MADDDEEIRALLADMEAGYREKDAERIVAAYAPDIVLFSLAPPLRVRRGDTLDIGPGRKADMTTAEGVREWLSGFGDVPFETETRDLEVVCGSDVAYVSGLSRMGSPDTFSMWFRITIGLRKRDGRWQITHLHESVPFYMDQNFRAAADLQP